MAELPSNSMTDPTKENRWLGLLCVGLLLLLGLVIYSQWVNRRERQAIEKLSELTAAGDRAFFPVPKKLDPKESLVTFKQQRLFPADRSIAREHDSLMLKLGKDDSGRYEVYRFSEEKPGRETHDYLKIGLEQFLPVEPK